MTKSQIGLLLKEQIDLVLFVCVMYEALPGVWGNRGKGIHFRVTGEQMPIFRGTEEQRQDWGIGNTRTTNFRFLGNRGTSKFISGEQGNIVPPPPGRASCMYRLLIISKYVPQTTKEGNIFGCIFCRLFKGSNNARNKYGTQ